MPRDRGVLGQVLSGTTDANIRFDELSLLLAELGFKERIRGSHHIYSRDSVSEILNLQPGSHGLAKPYQVRQVRNLLIKYNLR